MAVQVSSVLILILKIQPNLASLHNLVGFLQVCADFMEESAQERDFFQTCADYCQYSAQNKRFFQSCADFPHFLLNTKKAQNQKTSFVLFV